MNINDLILIKVILMEKMMKNEVWNVVMMMLNVCGLMIVRMTETLHLMMFLRWISGSTIFFLIGFKSKGSHIESRFMVQSHIWRNYPPKRSIIF